MEWYQCLAGFFAGAFFANAVPHFVHGISGDKFPTPFSRPSGKGLSSPTTNVIWALLNIIIGCSLMRISRFHHGSPTELLVIFAGIVVVSILLSISFRHKQTE